MKYFIKPFGCQFNKADGEKVAQMLEKKGYKQSPAIGKADLVVILACSVRQSAVNKMYSQIFNLKPVLPDGRPVCRQAGPKNIKKPRIIVAGCVLPNDKQKLVTMSVEVKTFKGLEKIKPQTGLVEIGQGCDNFCAYCVVPYTRGREKYRSPLEIIGEVKHLIKQGVKDISLIAQNVNSYKFKITNEKLKIARLPSAIAEGDCQPAKLRLAMLAGGQAIKNSKLKSEKSKQNIYFKDLLEMVNGLEGDFRVGFLTNHPKDMTDELIKIIAKLPKIKKEIHLPLQSGSTRILKKMNRHYTKQQYLKLVKKIRNTIPNVRLTTDIIVGFPGETEKDFQDTVDVVKNARFAQAFIAKYSPREGTSSFKMKDDVPFEAKKRREQVLLRSFLRGV